ncbi:MAG: tetratricopeptide repeat protein [Rhodobacteraceae bacterium]|nr:tetratricopeptide repeat protein [Paracoccaceae bacterium]
MSLLHTFGLPTLFLTATLAFPEGVFAAGSSDDSDPPAKTETTTKCDEGLVWDEEKKECVKPDDQSLNDDERFRAVREYAYYGAPEAGLAVLASMTEGDTDRVMTYRGFLNRKAGDIETGMMWYARALEVNPDNLLARSYRGQAFVEQGRLDLARLELAEIVARGGTGGWPERALRQAIATGQTVSY